MTEVKDVPDKDIAATHKFLKKREEAYYKSEKIPNDKKLIAVYIKDKKGQIIGGMSGYTKWRTLCLKYFYLDKPLRGHGVGMKLLNRLVEIAKSRDCKYAIFTTLDIGAPSLFKSFGSKIITLLDHAPKDHICYHYRVTL